MYNTTLSMIHRYLLPTLVLCSTAVTLHAQGTETGELDINNTHALFHSNGLIGLDKTTNTAHFFVPWVSGASPLFSAGLWVAGMAPDNTVHTAGQLYDADGFDYAPGPLTLGDASITPQTSFAYDRVWKITRQQIEQHQAYFDCLADPNCDMAAAFPNGYTTPVELYAWPAMGDVSAGQAQYLAPFNDRNGDGAYDPDDGDTPCVPGDQALFMIFNDKLAPHTASNGMPIGLEVHATPFAYTSLSDHVIDKTVFVRYRIINRGTVPLSNCFIGLFNDFDLGCPDDDFIGTDVGRNMIYVYNWDENDQACTGAPGYGTPPPAFGLTVLKGPLLDANGADDAQANSLPAWNGTGFGDGVADNERCGLTRSIYFARDGNNNMNDPELPIQFYNYLRGMWKDGTPLSYGGTGYSSDPNATPALFMFPGTSDPLGVGTGNMPQAGWSESIQAEPDRRMLGSMGPFTLGPQEEQEIVVAYVFSRSTDRLASVAQLQQDVDHARTFANALPGIIAPGAPCDHLIMQGVGEQPAGEEVLLLYPNPAQELITIATPLHMPKGKHTVRILDAMGRQVMERTVSDAKMQLDVRGLAPGTYVVQLTAGAEMRYARFIRQ